MMGSIVDFASSEASPPTGKSTFSPKRQLHIFNIEHLSRMPESVIRKWVAKWWH
jgi:hypothetical protein